MKYTSWIGSTVALLTVCMPAFAGTVSTASASGNMTIDGRNQISCDVQSMSRLMRTGRQVLGQIDIACLSGPFAGDIYAPVASIDFSTVAINGVSYPKAVVHSAEFWYADYSQFIPGQASSIKYTKAFCDVTIIKMGTKGLVGFVVRRSGDGAILAATAPDLQTAAVLPLAGTIAVAQ